jgi:hypothetical protein
MQHECLIVDELLVVLLVPRRRRRPQPAGRDRVPRRVQDRLPAGLPGSSPRVHTVRGLSHIHLNRSVNKSYAPCPKKKRVRFSLAHGHVSPLFNYYCNYQRAFRVAHAVKNELPGNNE